MRGIQEITWIITLIISAFVFTSCQSSTNNIGKEQLMKEKNIFKAIDLNDRKEVEHLLASNIDLEQTNEGGQTPLMLATYLKRNELAILLMKAGANVNAQDAILNSPFLTLSITSSLNCKFLIFCLGIITP